jgi:hypothetical protein
MTSAYPIDVDALIQQVQARAVELGEIPSRNRVMSEFRVGAPKAKAVLSALAEAGFDPTNAETATEPAPVRRLHSVPATESEPVSTAVELNESEQASTDANPAPETIQHDEERAEPNPGEPTTPPTKRVRSWPLLLLAAGAFVSIWGGWVGLGKLTGFGPIHLLPGIADGFVINSAITLPIGVEAYAAFALRVWLSAGSRSGKTRQFAMWSAIGSLVLGMAGQVAYHLMTAAGITAAPWPITTFVSCLPVVVLGCGAALAHLLHNDHEEAQR